MAKQDDSLHQGAVHFANQISSQLQGDKGVYQIVAMALIEAMRHNDQILTQCNRCCHVCKDVWKQIKHVCMMWSITVTDFPCFRKLVI